MPAFRCDETLNSDAVGKGGMTTVLPGFYGCRVDSYEHHEDKGYYVFAFEVLAASEGREYQVGCLHHEFFTDNMKAGNLKKQLALAVATGLVPADAAKAGHDVAWEWDDVVGLQCVIEIAEEEDQDGKKRYKIPYSNIYAPGSKAVKGKVKFDGDAEPFSGKAAAPATKGASPTKPSKPAAPSFL